MLKLLLLAPALSLATVAWTGAAPQTPSETLVVIDRDGTVLDGSLDGLIDAVHGGATLRVGWELSFAWSVQVKRMVEHHSVGRSRVAGSMKPVHGLDGSQARSLGCDEPSSLDKERGVDLRVKDGWVGGKNVADLSDEFAPACLVYL